MTNPFVFGTVVSGDNFAGRNKEIESLTQNLKETVKIALIAPPRYGKTSIVKCVLEILKKQGMLTAYIDLFAASSHPAILEHWSTSIFRGSRTLATKFADFFRYLRPKISLSEADLSPSITFISSFTSVVEGAVEVFDLAEKVAKRQNKRFVVAIDEFQELLNKGKEDLLMQLKASIIHHSNVSYLFTGSQKSILHSMFTDHRHPLHQVCTLMQLERMEKNELEKFIITKFNNAGKKIEPEAVKILIAESDRIPYYVQLICYNLYNHTQDLPIIEKKHVFDSLSILVQSQEPAFTTLWETLSLNERKVLEAVVKNRGKNLLSKDTIQQFEFKGPGPVKASLNSLTSNKSILRKESKAYIIEDVLFRKWISQIGLSRSISRKIRIEPSVTEWDVFVSHATEDKDDIARPLADALRDLGLKVWFDEFTLRVGDSLRRSIDHGLKSCRYGIVIISKQFLQKQWPQKELDGLTTRENEGRKVILPVWHKVSADQVAQYSPMLADRVATITSLGMEKVVNDLIDAMNV